MIQGQLLDSLSKEIIPFATVLSNFGENTISNEEGYFRINRSKFFTPSDSLFISCIGYKDLAISFEQLQDSLLYLTPKEIELNEIILSQQKLSAAEPSKMLLKNMI